MVGVEGGTIRDSGIAAYHFVKCSTIARMHQLPPKWSGGDPIASAATVLFEYPVRSPRVGAYLVHLAPYFWLNYIQCKHITAFPSLMEQPQPPSSSFIQPPLPWIPQFGAAMSVLFLPCFRKPRQMLCSSRIVHKELQIAVHSLGRYRMPHEVKLFSQQGIWWDLIMDLLFLAVFPIELGVLVNVPTGDNHAVENECIGTWNWIRWCGTNGTWGWLHRPNDWVSSSHNPVRSSGITSTCQYTDPK